MNTQSPQQLPTKQLLLALLFAVLFGGPAGYMVECHVGFGPWATDFQDKLFGMHSMKLATALVMLMEGLSIFTPLIIVGIAVRCITGRSLLDLLRKRK